MYYKCELKLNGISYDVTDDLINWADIEVALQRSSLGGVVRSSVSKFEFCGTAYDILHSSILVGGLENDANIVLYIQNNSWLWNKVFECRLNISTLSVSNGKISFSCVDDSVMSKINAKKSVKYEYNLSSLSKKSLSFGRIKMRNWEKFTLAVESSDGDGKFLSANYVYTDGQNGRYKLPLYYTENSIPVPGAIELYDQQSTKIANVADQGFLVCKKDITVHLRLKLRISGGWLGSSEYRPQMYLQKWSSQYNTYSTIQASVDYFDGIMTTQMALDVDRDISLMAGDTLLVTVQVPVISESILDNGRALFTVHDFRDEETNATLQVSWEDKGNPVSFDVITPETMIKALAESMCGPDVKCEIESSDNTRLSRCVLAPSDSIRGISDGKVYSSFADFCSFMECLFGYVYVVNDDTIRFQSRDSLFDSEVLRDLGENINNFELSVDSSLLYSAVNIGNDAVEYNEDNGRYEINFMQSFTTGYSFGENTLTLSPKYRVDSFGVEYLVEQRSQDSKDNKSDKDLFAIYTDENGNPDTSVRVAKSDGGVIDGIFNTEYHPRKCIEANRSYLATFSQNLIYASSLGFADFTGVSNVKSNVDLSQYRKYTPFSVKIDTDIIDEPEKFDGKVKIMYGGVNYSGWITRLKVKYTREESAEYTLMLDAESIG